MHWHPVGFSGPGLEAGGGVRLRQGGYSELSAERLYEPLTGGSYSVYVPGMKCYEVFVFVKLEEEPGT